VRNSQDRGDHIDRNRHAERAHQIERPAGIDPVQGLGDDPLDLRLEPGHPGVEGLRERLADAGVVGIVEGEDAAGFAAQRPLGQFLGARALQQGALLGLEGIAPHRPVGDQRADVVVAGQEHAAGALVLIDRTAGAQIVQHVVRFGPVVRIERGELEEGGKGLVVHAANSDCEARGTLIHPGRARRG